MDVKRLDKFVRAMVHGVTMENFPLLMADVYVEVIKVKGLKKSEIQQRCVDALNYIVDNTDAGKYDAEIDELMKSMIPGLVTAFMNVEPRKFCCC